MLAVAKVACVCERYDHAATGCPPALFAPCGAEASTNATSYTSLVFAVIGFGLLRESLWLVLLPATTLPQHMCMCAAAAAEAGAGGSVGCEAAAG